MIVYKRLKLKNCPTFIFDKMTNIKEIDPSVIGVSKVSLTNYEIGYFSKLIYDNPLYIIFNDVDAYFLSINEEKYLIFASTDKNKDILANYKKLWDFVKREISKINEEIEIFDFKGDVMKIKFKSNDKVPLSKIINIPMCTKIVKSVFKVDCMFYPKTHLHSCYLEYDTNSGSYV